MSDAFELVDEVQTRADLIGFIRALRDDLVHNDQEWENPTLERFLEALAAWTSDLDGYFINKGKPVPTSPNWKLFAQMLAAASVYE